MTQFLLNQKPTSNVVVIAAADKPAVELGTLLKELIEEFDIKGITATDIDSFGAALAFPGILSDLNLLFSLYHIKHEFIGDGKSNIHTETIENAIVNQPENALIIALAHGIDYPGCGHLLSGIQDKDISAPVMPTIQLFDTIRKTGRPMDIVMSSCQSGVTHKDADTILPAGSRFLTFGNGAEDVDRSHALHVFGFGNMAKAMARGQHWTDPGTISFQKILFNTLLTASETMTLKSSPTLTIAGSGTCHFGDMLEDHRGKRLTPLEEFYIRARLPEFDGVKDGALLRTIQDKAGSTLREDRRYGRALASILAANRFHVPLKQLT